MKSKTTKLLALLLACAMIFGLAACGEKAPEATEAPAVEPEVTEAPAAPVETEPVEIDYKNVEFRIGWWGGDARHNSTIAFIEEFEKGYKNLTIDVEYAGWGDYWTRLSTQAAGGELPDIIQLDYSYIEQYASAGLLMPLDSFLADGSLDLSNVSESTYSSGIVDGKLVAVPCGVNSSCYAYDPAVLDSLGLSFSENPTWDEFTEICETVYEQTGAMAHFHTDLTFHARTFGENWLASDGKSLGLSVSTLCDYWQRFYDGFEHGWLHNPVDTPIDSWGAALKTGQMWLVATPTNNIGNLLNESGKELKFLPLPVAEEGIKPGFSKPSMLWAITSNCENPELALEFINYYVNDIRVYEISGFDRAVPISNVIRGEMKDLTPDQVMQIEFISWMEDGHASALFAPNPTCWSEATAVLDEINGRIDYRQLDPADHERLANEAIDAANKVLSAAD